MLFLFPYFPRPLLHEPKLRWQEERFLQYSICLDWNRIGNGDWCHFKNNQSLSLSILQQNLKKISEISIEKQAKTQTIQCYYLNCSLQLLNYPSIIRMIIFAILCKLLCDIFCHSLECLWLDVLHTSGIVMCPGNSELSIMKKTLEILRTFCSFVTMNR